MKAFEIGTIEKTEQNMKWFNREGYTMTGETLKLGDESSACTYVVFKGGFTRYDTVRDCGDHYIKAGWSSYTRIDKGTLKITLDVEDR